MNLLTIKTLKDGSIERAFLNYTNYTDALSALYYALWVASSDQNVTVFVAELISDDGRVDKCERYYAPVPVESEAENNE